jgi:probable HAF family extracellular repeat protein
MVVSIRMFLILRSLGLICVICFASLASAQNRYRITRIPTPQGANSAALGINNKGEVVGYSFQGEDYQAFLYSPSDQSVTDVGSLGGKINAACAINDSGQVVGYSQDGNGNLLAFIFSRNQSITSLGTLDGASSSEAFGINNRGTVVGDSQSGNQNHRPVLFSKDSVQDLGLGASNEPDALETAYAVNDAGQIVGRHSVGQNAFHAFSFLNGTTTDFGTLGGTNGEAFAINKNGVVVGDSVTADGTPHAFVFEHSQLKDLGTLPGFDKASYARGINNANAIVGESDSAEQKRAFLFAKDRLVQLDRLTTNLSDSGFNSLDVAYDINDKGWIVGYGTTTDNGTAAFIAVPEGRDNQGQAGGTPQPQVQRSEGPPQPQPQDRDQEQPVSESDQDDYDVFYSGLSADEGNWVEAGNYGYCFRPRVSENWRPYRDGHWVWTDHGWYWDSNERFGWATYHYGRWVNIRRTGWCWVPGNQWAPAWVSWRESNENVGWAPLPPEANVSVQQPISSWSDSYYGIGPAAYAFISYSHWREPNYARYIVPSERNVQIINETRNVTNIVNNNNVINNFGPPVQNVARRTNQNIQPVQLAFSPTTGRRANYGQTRQGNQLNVIAPPATLKTQAARLPSVQNRIANPEVEKGWRGVKPQNAEKLKRTIAEQNPQPKDLAKSTPFVNPQIGNKPKVTGTPRPAESPATLGAPTPAPGAPTPAPGQKLPPNLLKPGPTSPKANVPPGTSPTPPAPGKKPGLANLPGARPTGSPAGPIGQPTPMSSPGPKQSPSANVPVGSPSRPKGIPPNLNVQKSATPVQPVSPGNQPTAKPTPKPPSNLPPAQNPSRPSPTPQAAAATPTPHNGPANLITPKPTSTPPPPSNQEAPKPISTPSSAPANVTPESSAPKPTPVPATRAEPPTVPKATPQVNAPKQEIKTPPPEVVGTPAPQPQVVRTPSAQPPAQKALPPKQESKPVPQVQRAPAPPPRVVHTAPAQPPAEKAPPPKQEIKAPPPQVHHAPAPPAPRVVHTAPVQPPAQKAPPPKQQSKPAPQVQRAPAPPPRVVHSAPAQPPAQKAPPPKQPQGGQKHEPAKAKPTPAP